MSNLYDSLMRILGSMLHFLFSDYFSLLPAYSTPWTIVHYVVEACIVLWVFLLAYTTHRELLNDGTGHVRTVSMRTFTLCTGLLLSIGLATPAIVKMIADNGHLTGNIYRACMIMEMTMLLVPIFVAGAAVLIYHTTRMAKSNRTIKQRLPSFKATQPAALRS